MRLPIAVPWVYSALLGIVFFGDLFLVLLFNCDEGLLMYSEQIHNFCDIT